MTEVEVHIPWLLTCGLLCTLCPTIPGCRVSGNYEGVTACSLGETFTLYIWEILLHMRTFV